jgi:hypothetical protein
MMPTCPIIEWKVTDVNTGVNVPTPFTQDPVPLGGNMVVRPVDYSLHSSYKFYVRMKVEGGNF